MNDMRLAERSVDTDAKAIKFQCRDVQVSYGEKHAIKDVNVDLLDKTVTAFIGPSGCGKSTFLRCLNRMNDTIPVARVAGRMLLDGEDIYDRRVDPVQLRAQVGMVFQKPNPFPKSIYDNVAYGARIHGLARSKAEDARISVRNHRRWAKDSLDKMVKDKEVGEDEVARAEKQLDQVTKTYVDQIDDILKNKEAELLEV